MDKYTGKIEVMSLNGQNRRVIYQLSSNADPFGLALVVGISNLWLKPSQLLQNGVLSAPGCLCDLEHCGSFLKNFVSTRRELRKISQKFGVLFWFKLPPPPPPPPSSCRMWNFAEPPPQSPHFIRVVHTAGGVIDGYRCLMKRPCPSATIQDLYATCDTRVKRHIP